MRAFLSCPLPDKLIAYLKTLLPLLPNAKYIIPKQNDLTMKFLGSVSDSDIPKLVESLSSIRFSPFEAKLSKIGVFSEQTIRVVWVGVEPVKSFSDLHKLIDESLLPIFQADNRFLPHITLARVKGFDDRKAFLNRLLSIPVTPMPFVIDRLILMKSELTSTGAVHTPLYETGSSS